MKVNNNNAIQIEREKLNQMIDDSIKHGISLSENKNLQRQSKFLERLFEQSRKYEEK